MNKSSLAAWRRRSPWWMIPLLVCIVNTAAMLFYQARLSGSVAGWLSQIEAVTKNRSALEAEHQKTQAFLESLNQREEDRRILYEEHFSTQEKRWTRMIREAKKLAQQAGLQPKNFSYPQADLIEGELQQHNMVFPVQGTYNQLRTFINFLELDDQFLTLEQVTLTGSNDTGGSGVLSIQLRLSTVFAPEVKARREGTS